MKRCQPTSRSQSADGQTDGELLRDLAHQVNDALQALLKRIEALEKRQATTSSPAVIIQVGQGASVSVDPPENERMGFNRG